MQYKLVLLSAMAPSVLGCLNANSNPCASFIKSQAATASPFCATFTTQGITATTALPAWATHCSKKPKLISAECSCYYTGGGSQPTTTRVTTTGGSNPTTSRTTTGGSNPTTTGGNTGPAPSGLVGYGAGTTGGGSGTGTTVTSCSQLSSAISAGGVIRVSGTLSGCGSLRVQSNTSILGVGSSSAILSTTLQLRDVSNIIIRNLRLSPPSKGDAVSLDNAQRVWVDHNEFHSIGMVGGKDDFDGLLDITHGSDSITVSWNKFRDHWKGSLVGHSDSNSSEDRGKLRVTYHHNSFINVNSRLPSLRFGTGHMFSNCYRDIPTSGINSRMGAQVLVEQNHFSNVQLAIVTDLDSSSDGYAVERNNIFDSSTTRITQVGSLSPPYSYTTTPAANVCSTVASNAGPGRVSV